MKYSNNNNKKKVRIAFFSMVSSKFSFDLYNHMNMYILKSLRLSSVSEAQEELTIFLSSSTKVDPKELMCLFQIVLKWLGRVRLQSGGFITQTREFTTAQINIRTYLLCKYVLFFIFIYIFFYHQISRNYVDLFFI